MAEFSLNPALDVTALGDAYRRARRLDIDDWLPAEQAETLRRHLLDRSDWTLVLNAGEKVYELPRSRSGELDGAQREQLERFVIDSARDRFQYRFESIRSPDRGGDATLLDRFVAFMSSPEVIGFLGAVTGQTTLSFADGQATLYSPGHFLTAHDDDVAGKNRLAAYVFGLSPEWHADWGGLLMFHGRDGNVDEAFTPGMNRLRLFSVPVSHGVSYVTPFAAHPRLSVTGWLRAG